MEPQGAKLGSRKRVAVPAAEREAVEWRPAFAGEHEVVIAGDRSRSPRRARHTLANVRRHRATRTGPRLRRITCSAAYPPSPRIVGSGPEESLIRRPLRSREMSGCRSISAPCASPFLRARSAWLGSTTARGRIESCGAGPSRVYPDDSSVANPFIRAGTPWATAFVASDRAEASESTAEILVLAGLHTKLREERAEFDRGILGCARLTCNLLFIHGQQDIPLCGPA